MSWKTWTILLLALGCLALVLLTGCTVRQIPLFSTQTPTASPTAPLPFPIPPTPHASNRPPTLASPVVPVDAGLRKLFLPFASFSEK